VEPIVDTDDDDTDDDAPVRPPLLLLRLLLLLLLLLRLFMPSLSSRWITSAEPAPILINANGNVDTGHLKPAGGNIGGGNGGDEGIAGEEYFVDADVDVVVVDIDDDDDDDDNDDIHTLAGRTGTSSSSPCRYPFSSVGLDSHAGLWWRK